MHAVPARLVRRGAHHPALGRVAVTADHDREPAQLGRRSTSTAAMNWSRSTCSTQDGTAQCGVRLARERAACEASPVGSSLRLADSDVVVATAVPRRLDRGRGAFQQIDQYPRMVGCQAHIAVVHRVLSRSVMYPGFGSCGEQLHSRNLPTFTPLC